MWANDNRGRYDRSCLRYPIDLTDAEWAHVAPLMPPARSGGKKRHMDVREIALSRRSPIVSTCGAGKVRSIASTTRSM
jgi:transposase